MVLAPPDRFRAKVAEPDPLTGCRVWTRATDRSGYGRFGVRRGLVVFAHRYAWALANGPIPDGVKVLHRCDNPPCCEPTHLFLGTHVDNMADWKAKGYGQGPACRRGHEWTEENTHYYQWRGSRLRRCRACARERARSERAARGARVRLRGRRYA